MRARVLLPLGIVAAFVLALPSYAPASHCTQPYCPSHTLSVKKAGSGSGTVTSSPAGIACGAQCSAPYEEATNVMLTAQAAPGSTFVGWSGGGCAGKGKCVVKIAEADVTVTATFDAEKPPPPPNEFTLGKVRHPETGVVTIQIRVPGPGTIEASAHLMRSLRGKAKAAGTYKLTLRLTRRGMRRLERSRGQQLRTRVTFAFTPTGGETATKLKKIIFRVVRRHGGRKPHRAQISTVPLDESAAGGKAVVASTATIKPGTASIRLFCNGPQACRGELKLLASPNALLSSAGFELEAGASRVMRMKLTGRGRKLLGAKHPPKTRAAGTGLHPHAVKLKFPA